MALVSHLSLLSRKYFLVSSSSQASARFSTSACFSVCAAFALADQRTHNRTHGDTMQHDTTRTWPEWESTVMTREVAQTLLM